MDPLEREKRDENDRWESSLRRHHFHTGASIILALALIGLAWYAYPMLKRQDTSIAGLRQQLRDKVQQVEDETAQNSSSQRSFRIEADKVGRDLKSRINAMSKRATQAAMDAYNKIQDRLDAETRRLDAEIKSRNDGVANLTERISTLEASHTADQTQLAQLKQELNQVREQADQRAVEEAARQVDELAQAGPSNNPALQKITFEADKNHTSELTGGISFYVSGTDVANRRVSGSMWVASENRNIWLRDQSALEPIIFYGSQDGLKRELVITNVNTNSVTGYLLLPKPNSQTALETGAGGE